jgi:hypothetical protein
MSDIARQPSLFGAHRNHFLFADYYLNHRVQERAEWQAGLGEAGVGGVAGVVGAAATGGGE